MYAPYFGLSKEPFSIAPDPRFLFMSEQHREALAHLLYGLGGGGGFVLLTGEIGAGKTTVCRCFLEQVPPNCAVAYVFNPKLTAAELLQTVCHEFGIAPPADSGSLKAHVDALNSFLLQSHAQGRQAVLVIDEAQALSADVLEQLRLLTNLETTERKLLQIVLIGQPELRTMLARPDLEQLAQRVIARFHLGPLNLRETQQYIRHRLAVAGPTGPTGLSANFAALPFDSRALARIHALSGGVPRRINLLADRALLGAYAQSLQRADRRTVDQAAREVFFGAADRKTALRWWPAALATLVVVMVVAGGAAWAVWQLQRNDRSAAALARAVAPVGVVASVAPVAVRGAPLATPEATPEAAPEVANVVAPVSSAVLLASSLPAAAGPAVVTASTPAGVASNDVAPLLAAAHADAATAWRELALRWNVSIGEGEPCVAALQAELACFRSPAPAGLPAVRQLARPGVLTLRGADGKTRHAVLSALTDNQATLQAAGRSFAISLPALASVWRGEFATFWRTPAGWREGSDNSAWVNRQLPGAGSALPLRERIHAFQLAEGLPPDGVAGPMTLMRLNRAAGLQEPQLQGVN